MHKTIETDVNKETYWDGYYRTSRVPDIPSQFAVFVANEITTIDSVIDIGCGNGRDAIFFSSIGKNVLGIDGSSAAIEVCNEKRRILTKERLAFVQCRIDDHAVDEYLLSLLRELSSGGEVMLYSRFFLHAITDAQEQAFLQICTQILKNRGGFAAFEFRTRRDELQPKSTSSHYRRFIDPVNFFSRAEKAGFGVEYFVEGFGFAKYKNDDAHAARFILRLK